MGFLIYANVPQLREPAPLLGFDRQLASEVFEFPKKSVFFLLLYSPCGPWLLF
jgi:hypothetical protein